MRYTPGYDPIQQLWDRDRKIARDNFCIKIKSTGLIYLAGSRFCEAEGHLTMRSCLQDTVINYAPRNGKQIDKQELYSQCPPKKIKDSNISDAPILVMGDK